MPKRKRHSQSYRRCMSAFKPIFCIGWARPTVSDTDCWMGATFCGSIAFTQYRHSYKKINNAILSLSTTAVTVLWAHTYTSIPGQPRWIPRQNVVRMHAFGSRYNVHQKLHALYLSMSHFYIPLCIFHCLFSIPFRIFRVPFFQCHFPHSTAGHCVFVLCTYPDSLCIRVSCYVCILHSVIRLAVSNLIAETIALSLLIGASNGFPFCRFSPFFPYHWWHDNGHCCIVAAFDCPHLLIQENNIIYNKRMENCFEKIITKENEVRPQFFTLSGVVNGKMVICVGSIIIIICLCAVVPFDLLSLFSFVPNKRSHCERWMGRGEISSIKLAKKTGNNG